MPVRYHAWILCFDGEWIPAYTSDMGKDLYQYIMKMEPEMIVSNRVDKGSRGMAGMNAEGESAGDFGTPEQEIPDTGLEGADWESCMTMNVAWGFKHFDHNWKSGTMLIRNLADGSTLDMEAAGGRVCVSLPGKAPDCIATVVVVE